MRGPARLWRITALGLVLVFRVTAWCQQPREERWTEANGIRFKVLDGYKNRKSRNLGVLIFDYSDTTSSSLIKMYFEHRATNIAGRTQEEMDRFGLRRTGERKAMLAGRDGECVEYSVKAKSVIALAQAECSFGTELHASFFGSPERIVDFYVFIQAAERARKERQA